MKTKSLCQAAWLGNFEELITEKGSFRQFQDPRFRQQVRPSRGLRRKVISKRTIGIYAFMTKIVVFKPVNGTHGRHGKGVLSAQFHSESNRTPLRRLPIVEARASSICRRVLDRFPYNFRNPRLHNPTLWFRATWECCTNRSTNRFVFALVVL